ncbi:hypothetical protein D3C87_1624090 [compost metagenome]
MLAALGVHLIGVVAAGVPSPPLDLHDLAVCSGELAVQLEADLASQFLAGRVAHQDETMNEPCFFTRPECPDTPLVAVVLCVDATDQDQAEGRDLRVNFAAAIQNFGVELLALVVVPRFAASCVDKGDQLRDVAFHLQPFFSQA